MTTYLQAKKVILQMFKFPGWPKGQTAMTTGMLKGTVACSDWGSVSNEILYSRP